MEVVNSISIQNPFIQNSTISENDAIGRKLKIIYV